MCPFQREAPCALETLEVWPTFRVCLFRTPFRMSLTFSLPFTVPHMGLLLLLCIGFFEKDVSIATAQVQDEVVDGVQEELGTLVPQSACVSYGYGEGMVKTEGTCVMVFVEVQCRSDAVLGGGKDFYRATTCAAALALHDRARGILGNGPVEESPAPRPLPGPAPIITSPSAGSPFPIDAQGQVTFSTVDVSYLSNVAVDQSIVFPTQTAIVFGSAQMELGPSGRLSVLRSVQMWGGRAGTLTLTNGSAVSVRPGAVLTVQVKMAALRGSAIRLDSGILGLREGGDVAGTTTATGLGRLEVWGTARLTGCLVGQGELRVFGEVYTGDPDGPAPCPKELPLTAMGPAIAPKRRPQPTDVCAAAATAWVPCGRYHGPAVVQEGAALAVGDCTGAAGAGGAAAESNASLTLRSGAVIEVRGGAAPRFESVALEGPVAVRVRALGNFTILSYGRLSGKYEAFVACGCGRGPQPQPQAAGLPSFRYRCVVSVGAKEMVLSVHATAVRTESEGLSPLAILFVCLGAVAGVAALAFLLKWRCRRRRAAASAASAPPADSAPASSQAPGPSARSPSATQTARPKPPAGGPPPPQNSAEVPSVTFRVPDKPQPELVTFRVPDKPQPELVTFRVPDKPQPELVPVQAHGGPYEKRL